MYCVWDVKVGVLISMRPLKVESWTGDIVGTYYSFTVYASASI